MPDDRRVKGPGSSARPRRIGCSRGTSIFTPVGIRPNPGLPTAGDMPRLCPNHQRSGGAARFASPPRQMLRCGECNAAAAARLGPLLSWGKRDDAANATNATAGRKPNWGDRHGGAWSWSGQARVQSNVELTPCWTEPCACAGRKTPAARMIVAVPASHWANWPLVHGAISQGAISQGAMSQGAIYQGAIYQGEIPAGELLNLISVRLPK